MTTWTILDQFSSKNDNYNILFQPQRSQEVNLCFLHRIGPWDPGRWIQHASELFSPVVQHGFDEMFEEIYGYPPE